VDEQSQEGGNIIPKNPTILVGGKAKEPAVKREL
jgi:hypothetical protein